jgi:excisionase family DNA binding protein
MINNLKTLTTGEIGIYCNVTYRAVLKWISSGKLKAYRTPGNHSRVRVDEFLSFLGKYNIPIPEELRSFEIKKKILIVDDDQEMVDSIKRMLMMEDNYKIETAYDGFSAGQKFYQFKPDLVILDIKMPKLNGYEVCARIRSDPQNKEVKIIAISGVIDMAGAQEIKKLGANDYLSKPFDNTVLKRKIEKLLDLVKENS